MSIGLTLLAHEQSHIPNVCKWNQLLGCQIEKATLTLAMLSLVCIHASLCWVIVCSRGFVCVFIIFSFAPFRCYFRGIFHSFSFPLCSHSQFLSSSWHCARGGDFTRDISSGLCCVCIHSLWVPRAPLAIA